MQTGYYNVIGGMVTQFNKLNVTSNNLANLNTSGFKQDKTIIGDFKRLYQEKRDILPLGDNTVDGSKFINSTLTRVPQVSEVYTDFSLGPIKKTSSQLDIAIMNKEKFFVIKVGDDIRLSKNGSFTLNQDGNLVTKNGNKVLDKNKQPIIIKASDSINIDKNGNIYTDNNKIGSLFIASIDNIKKLEKIGNNNFDFKNQKLHHNANTNAISQGFLEQSNVNPVFAMTELIAINRLLEMSQKAATTQMDDMNSDAINKIAVNK
jgi:flagellar basal-body rod protein FlgG